MDIFRLFFLEIKKGVFMMKYDNEFWKLLDELFLKHEIVIDRPRGTAHPKYHEYI